jgi:hypothetical protein
MCEQDAEQLHLLCFVSSTTADKTREGYRNDVRAGDLFLHKHQARTLL